MSSYRINGFDQIKAIYQHVFNHPGDLRPTHVSLYMFLLNQNNRNNWVEWFKCPYDLAMAGACIGSRSTYYKCLDDLKRLGFIDYVPGVNNNKSPLIKMFQLSNNGQVTVPLSEQVTEQLTVPVSEQVAVPLPEHIYKPITNNLKLITDNILEFQNLINKWIETKKKVSFIDFEKIVSYLNEKSKKSFKSSSKKTKECIKARFNEGFKEEDFMKVIDVKCAKWLNDPKMSEYLRPETLFGTKFESYLQENVVQKTVFMKIESGDLSEEECMMLYGQPTKPQERVY